MDSKLYSTSDSQAHEEIQAIKEEIINPKETELEHFTGLIVKCQKIYLTIPEVAEMAGLKHGVIRKYIKYGLLKASQICPPRGTWKIHIREVGRFFRGKYRRKSKQILYKESDYNR